MQNLLQRGFHTLFAAVALFAILGMGLYGQITSATILGTVTDPTAKAIPGAKIDLVEEATGLQRTGTSDANGAFSFPSLPQGSYTIRIEAAGFQKLERKGNNLSSGTQLALGDLQLSVGAVTETVSVVAQGAQVQTASSESSQILTVKQLDTIAQKGRVVTNYLLMMPGFNTNGGTFDAASSFMNVPNANGLSNQMTAISVDGFQGADTTSPNLFVTNFNPDAIGEMTVLLNNYQAEYGRNGGASVNLITKSGGRQYHGTAYWYKRHEMFNANEFFLNRSGRPKNLYRFNTEGVSIGGPVLPPLLKRSREKLFFFYNFDNSPSVSKTRAISTLPTLLERTGDFSQTFAPGATGGLIVIKDPTTGAAYPGNVIPTGSGIGRINPDGQKLLGIFTPPNAGGKTAANNFGAFNNEFSSPSKVARGQHVYRIDYRPGDKDSINFRGTWFQTNTTSATLGTGNGAWNYFDNGFKAPNKTWVLGWTHIVSSTMVNEFTGGIRRPREFFIPITPDVLNPGNAFLGTKNRAFRETYGFSPAFDLISGGVRGGDTKLGQSFFPVGHIMPNGTFGGGGLQNTPFLSGNTRLGATEADFVYYYQDNITWNKNKHTIKAGYYFEGQKETEGAGIASFWNGSFSFDVDGTSPVNTGNPFANALTGNFTRYQESQKRTVPAAVTNDWEWFVQDSWKVTKRLTLELGLRSVFFTPYYGWAGISSQWMDDRYSPQSFNRTTGKVTGTIPQLYLPSTTGCGALGTRCAVDPRNGNRVIAPLGGTYVPGTGDPAAGAVLSILSRTDPKSVPKGFYNNDGWKFQPRFGFAYDPFGKGRTSVRGGFSAQNQLLRYANRASAAPFSYDPVLFWGNLSDYASQQGAISPGTLYGFERNKPIPTIYNLSLGVQHDVGHSTIVDVKYVSTMARHLATYRELETLPKGTRFNPSAVNPLTGSPYPDTFLRPLLGWNNLSFRETGGSSNYQGLQATVNRRFSTGLQFGVSYTFSKAMDYTQSISPGREGSIMPMYETAKFWSYGKSGFDQTHLFALNYTYLLPNMSKKMAAGGAQHIVHHVFDNWELSGVTTLSSGTPANIGICTSSGTTVQPLNGGAGCTLSFSDGADLLGGGDGQRANITGDPRLAHGDRNVDHMFNTSVFSRPAKGDIGNVGNGIVRIPGIVNFDATLFKRFPLPGEGRSFELRWEAYNVFNHTQFGAMNQTATFNAAGAQTNAAFGQATLNRAPRVMQVALRIRF